MLPQMVELHDVDVPAFLKVLDSCEGDKIAEAFVMCEREADESKLFRFNLYKKGVEEEDDI